jgi:hypothetical protein
MAVDRHHAKALRLAVLAAFAFAFAFAGPAVSADWWYVNRGEDRVLLVDAASIEAHGAKREYWTSLTIADGAQDGVRMVKTFVEADCARQRAGWSVMVRYDRDDQQIDVDTLPRAGSGEVLPNTLDSAELAFVCAPKDERPSGTFAVVIDPRTFADALQTAADDVDSRELYDRLAADPKTPIIRSTAPDPDTFGQRQTVQAGQPLVPPRDYARGTQIPNAADHKPDVSGDIYDVAFQGVEGGKMRFETRGYSFDDMIHPASGQTEGFVAEPGVVTVRDLAITVEKVSADAITYRVRVEKPAN